MEYKQYTLEELHNMFEKGKNPKELNKIMGTISAKHDVSSNNNEETNNVQLEEKIYQQMNLIKLKDLNVLPLEEVRRNLDKKYGKMAIEDEMNEIGEEFNLGEIGTNLITMLFLNLKNLVNLLEEIFIL